MIEPGVSSMSTSTPEARSKARMLRPSLPMILPLISSLGMETVVVVTSEVVTVGEAEEAETQGRAVEVTPTLFLFHYHSRL